MSQSTELRFRFDHSQKDALIGALYFHGITSFQEGLVSSAALGQWQAEEIEDEDTAITCWFESHEQASELIENLQQYFVANELDWAITWETRIIEAEQWIDTWKQFACPIAIGQEILIVPSSCSEQDVEQYANRSIKIQIDPQLAFGSGSHQTTKLCLTELELEMASKASTSMLDVGCGSGILSIAAAKLGATKLIGIDISAEAITCAKDNAKLNQTPQCQFATSKLQEIQGNFEIVCANILSGTLVELWGCLQRATAPGGALILSGVLCDELDSFLPILGREPTKISTDGEWVAILFRC